MLHSARDVRIWVQGWGQVARESTVDATHTAQVGGAQGAAGLAGCGRPSHTHIYTTHLSEIPPLNHSALGVQLGDDRICPGLRKGVGGTTG